jgi:GNAT superfamily N-acetyltransferase
MRETASAKLHIVKTFMEMRERPAPAPAPASPDALLLRAPTPEPAFYRWLFGAVGEPWLWWTRALMTDGQLREVIHDPRVEIHVLYVEGQPAGFMELDRRTEGEVELAFCGLIPRFIGRRFGEFLVRSAVAYAWAPPNASRLWLHTCTLDHPRAVEFYRRHGFVAYRTQEEAIDDPRRSGRLSPHAGWLSPALAQATAQ